MPKGFFSSSTLLAAAPPPTVTPACGACGLYRGCRSPKMPPSGQGRRRVLIVAEAPGKDEDAEGTQLIGKAGQRLRSTLDRLGVDLDRDCRKTNTLICRPPNNDTPTAAQIEACRPNLLAEIREHEPEVIVLLGGPAVASLLGYVWRGAPGSIGTWAGWQIPCHEPNAWICPTWHPSYLEREDGQKRDGNRALALWWERHLQAALSLRGRPWPDGPPDYSSRVRTTLDADRAARWLREARAAGGRIAVDYETTTLKPDGPDSRIVSCAVCWEGRRTLSYPWEGPARAATGELLAAENIQCIASNMKFEERWTMAEFGHGVRRWLWDTMVGGHILDNRPGVTSIKFQAFVRLGVPLWNVHVDPFLESSGGGGCYAKNQIDEVDLQQLLVYGGLDALLEFEVAMHQMKEMGRGNR